jgi:hypothetical protein
MQFSHMTKVRVEFGAVYLQLEFDAASHSSLHASKDCTTWPIAQPMGHDGKLQHELVPATDMYPAS